MAYGIMPKKEKNMKRIFVISVLLIVLLLTVASCNTDIDVTDVTSNITSNTKADNITNITSSTTTNEILGTYTPTYYEVDAVPDEETAIALGKIYFEKVIQSKGYFQGYFFGGVFVRADNDYMIWFNPDDKHEGMFFLHGDSYPIVIDRETGQVQFSPVE